MKFTIWLLTLLLVSGATFAQTQTDTVHHDVLKFNQSATVFGVYSGEPTGKGYGMFWSDMTKWGAKPITLMGRWNFSKGIDKDFEAFVEAYGDTVITLNAQDYAKNGLHHIALRVTPNTGIGCAENMHSTWTILPAQGKQGHVLTTIDDKGNATWMPPGISTPSIRYTPMDEAIIPLYAGQYTIVDPDSMLVALTFDLPHNPIHGEVVEVKFTTVISTVKFSGGMVGRSAPSSVRPGSYLKLVYDAEKQTWY